MWDSWACACAAKPKANIVKIKYLITNRLSRHRTYAYYTAPSAFRELYFASISTARKILVREAAPVRQNNAVMSKLDIIRLTESDGTGFFRGEPVKVVFREDPIGSDAPWLSRKHRQLAYDSALAAGCPQYAQEIAHEPFIDGREAEKAKIVEFFCFPFDEDDPLEIDDPLWGLSCGFRNGPLLLNFRSNEEKVAAARLCMERGRDDLANMVRRTPVVVALDEEPRLLLHENFRYIWEPHRALYYLSGRAVGKSWGIGIALLLISLETKSRNLMAREVQRSLADSNKKVLEDQIYRLKLDKYFRITNDEITCRLTGAEFMFKGLHPSSTQSIKSVEGVTHVFVDEAQSVSRASITALEPTIRAAGSILIYSMNPDKPDDPVYEDAHSDRPRSRTVKMTYKQNPLLKEDLVTDIIHARDNKPRLYVKEYGGDLERNTELRLFHEDEDWRRLPKGHNMRRRHGDFPGVPVYAERVAGADWGFSNDPCAFFVGWLWENHLYVEHAIYVWRANYDELAAVLAGDDPKWPNPNRHPGIEGIKRLEITADNESASSINELRERGFEIKPAKKGPGSKEDGIRFLQGLMIWVPEHFRDMIRELELASYESDSKTGKKLRKIADGHDHLLDSARYSIEHRRRNTSARKIDLGIPIYTMVHSL